MTSDELAGMRQRVAELEQENAALKQQGRTPFPALFDDVPVPLTVYALDGTLLTINRAAEQFWQLRRADVARTINVFTDPQAQRQNLPVFFERARQGETCTTPPVSYDTAESDLELEEHQQRWGELTFFSLHDETGAVSHIAQVQRDVSADMQQMSAVKAQQQQIQEELNASEAKNRALLDAMPDLMFLHDKDGTYIDYQSPDDKLYAPPEVFLGKTMHEVLPPELAQQFQAAITQALEGKGVQVVEYTMPIEGTVRSYEARISAADSDKSLALIRDITDRKRTEEQLHLFRVLIENSPDGIGVADSQGIFTYVNPAYGELTGYGMDMIGMPVNALMAEDNDVDAGAIIGSMLQGDGFWRGEVTYQHKDGSPLPIQASVFVARDSQGEILGVPAIVRDITEQKRQQAELSIFKTMADTAPDGFGMADADGTLTYANAAYRDLTGYGDALIGMNFLDHFTDADRVLALEALTTTAEQGDWQGVLNFQRQDGSIIPIDTKGFVTRDEAGNINAVMGLFRDLSEQYRQEAERAALQEQIIEAQRATLRELSTPLIPISDNVVIMPLIGTLDSGRAQQVMETLLEGVSTHQAELAILDITGVSMVDTQVAQALVRSAQAVRLLGAQVMLTGLQPQIAQTLVHLGVDLSDIVTRGSLQAGIIYALGEDLNTTSGKRPVSS